MLHASECDTYKLLTSITLESYTTAKAKKHESSFVSFIKKANLGSIYNIAFLTDMIKHVTIQTKMTACFPSM